MIYNSPIREAPLNAKTGREMQYRRTRRFRTTNTPSCVSRGDQYYRTVLRELGLRKATILKCTPITRCRNAFYLGKHF